MRKSVSRSLLGLMLLVPLWGCEQSTRKPDSASRVTELRFGHDMAESSAHHVGALHFARLVEQRSQGKLKIKVFPGQQLGDDHAMIAMAQEGSLDIILPPTAKLSTLSPAMQLMDMPFLFPSVEVAYRVLDGNPGNHLLRQLEDQGLVGFGFWQSGFKQMTATREINSAEDLRALKFRIMRSEILRGQYEQWGVNSIPIEFSKTYKALQEGVVQAQENPLGSIYHMKFYEVQPYLVRSNHGYLAQVMAISRKTYEKLPVHYRQILRDAEAEARVVQRREANEMEAFYLSEIKNAGTQVVELNTTLKKYLQEESKKVLEKYRFTIGTEVIELATQLVEESLPASNDELVLALDADLAGNSALSGLAIKRGMEIAIDEINRAGGLLGKKLRLMSRDNSMVSARGIDNLERFSRLPNLLAIFGGISSPVVLSELDEIHNRKLLFLAPWAAATSIVENGFEPNYVFRASVRDEYAGTFLLENALAVSDKVALLLVNNGWGRSSHESLLKELAENKLQATTVQWFNWGEKQQQDRLNAIYDSGARVIIYVGNAVELAGFVKKMVTNRNTIPIFSHWGVIGAELPKLAGAALAQVDLRVLQTFSFVSNKAGKALSVLDSYKKLYAVNSADDVVAPVGTAHAYDLTHMLAMAVRKSGSSDMSEIRNTLERLGRYQGLVRSYDPPFTNKDHDALGKEDYILAQYRGTRLVPLQSENAAQ